ncbi:MAG: MmcQ/YjbR family DNA-binding protein [Terriglobales bacterium]|jgi:predicted DNA-binding protein (MmcQ/YjbR family)
MSVESIRGFCLSFPQATEKLQWGEVLCFKVGGKIFALLSLSSVPPRLMFKCEPEIFSELVEHEDIIPAPYLGRYHWVAFERMDVLPWIDTRELITESYEMVAAKARITRPNTACTSTRKSNARKTSARKTRPTRRRSKSRRAGK